MKTAILSVSNKEGLVPLARRLIQLEYTLIASGGTARAISGAGLAVRAVEDITHAKVGLSLTIGNAGWKGKDIASGSSCWDPSNRVCLGCKGNAGPFV